MNDSDWSAFEASGHAGTYRDDTVEQMTVDEFMAALKEISELPIINPDDKQ